MQGLRGLVAVKGLGRGQRCPFRRSRGKRGWSKVARRLLGGLKTPLYEENKYELKLVSLQLKV